MSFVKILKTIGLTFGFLTAAACATAQPYFGDNGSEWANDGECDDPRFIATNNGYGMAETLLDEDSGRDANDCRALYNTGAIRLRGNDDASATGVCDNIQFGSNDSEWANDGECDDPRFQATSGGYGMADELLGSDAFQDENDCRSLCNSGAIELRKN